MSLLTSTDVVTAEAVATLVGDRAVVDRLLSDFLTDKGQTSETAQIAMLAGLLREFLGGGKRLRPLLCCCGWRAVAGQGESSAMRRIAASLELFHTFAVIHDDVMDETATRRGRPTLHRLLAIRHSQHPAADRFAVNAAILLGDLALGWSYELVNAARLDETQAAAVWPLLDSMRTDTLAGQYLDLLTEGDRGADVDTALTICRYKTAKYTVDYPLRLGALLAGASAEMLTACTEYGIPLGEAFQLRDDLLGVFGDPARTGKPNLDDLRQGKHTALLAIARQRANSAQRRTLDEVVGDPALDEDQAAEVRGILVETGARDAVEIMITQRSAQAVRALDRASFQPQAAAALRYLVTTASQRER
ncbi:MAG TPA: polyprenyl synthetase family protein [Pseudonocardiaceae bacterium]|jgi:geranylgeranyl diphosphate synthase type I|nr:polyprenyl synthetase family protein [Pseudonocardiaceae bacterium]